MHPSRRSPRSARGFTLAEITLALVISTLLLIAGARIYITATNDAAATATGRYMLTVRGAVLNLLSTHYAALHGVDVSAAPAGTYPPVPPQAQRVLDAFNNAHGFSMGRLHAIDLKDMGFLPGGFPEVPSLGHDTGISLRRTGTCPGDDCAIHAYIYSCWAISASREALWDDDCENSPDVDPALLGQVMMATEGYGAHNLMDSARARGPLVDAAMADIWGGAGAPPPGVAVVVASLDATPFNQFVRQGDTRHIHLANALTTEGAITTRTGLILDTAVVNGSACDAPGMYATSVRGTLASCTGSTWFEQVRSVVTWRRGNLANGATIPRPACPAGTTPFLQIAQQRTDVTLTGSDINLEGTVTGSVSGTGTVSTTGSVSVNGAINGLVSNSPSSSVRVDQGVSTTGSGPWTVNITPADANARAVALAGCEYT